MLDTFYKPFHETVEKTSESAERQKGERELGIDPKSGKKVIARIGRYGPLVQIGGETEEDKPQFANLRTGQMIESLTLEDALELFKLPRLVGTFETKEIKANTGRFGPYLQHDGKFVSIPKGEDPMVINEARAIELIEAKRKVESERLIKSFKENADVQVLNGRWGPYFVIGKNNYKLPKDTDAKAITLVECLALAKEQDAAPKKTSKGKFAKKAK